jgi:hypothetical protein
VRQVTIRHVVIAADKTRVLMRNAFCAVSVGAMYVCMLYAILFLKLWSYVQVNMWCRLSSRQKSAGQGRIRRQLSYNNLQCKYKEACTISSMFYQHDADARVRLLSRDERPRATFSTRDMHHAMLFLSMRKGPSRYEDESRNRKDGGILPASSESR